MNNSSPACAGVQSLTQTVFREISEHPAISASAGGCSMGEGLERCHQSAGGMAELLPLLQRENSLKFLSPALTGSFCQGSGFYLL